MGAGQRFVQLDEFAARGNERLGKQSLNLHLVKVGVPDVAQGIGETELERFKDEVLNDRVVALRKRGNIESGENSQGEKNDQSLTVWRHFHHAMIAVLDCNWFDPFAVLCSEIGGRQIAATRVGGGDDLLGKFALVKQLAAVLSQFPPRPGQVRLSKDLTRFGWLPASEVLFHRLFRES